MIRQNPKIAEPLFNAAHEMKDYKYVTYNIDLVNEIKFRNIQNKEYPTDKILSPKIFNEIDYRNRRLGCDPDRYWKLQCQSVKNQRGNMDADIPIKFNSERQEIKKRYQMEAMKERPMFETQRLLEITKHLEHQIAREESGIPFDKDAITEALLSKFGE